MFTSQTARELSMRISYQYRLKPNKQQRVIIDNTLNMLPHQYNYQLAQRFDWYE
ncbi:MULTISPECIES: helix-turn-helix domain-containing protein [unclassified Okeania]|uniref:helix-turn-helix domain-containing protein n=1 Tax=unclassified Okeania TaxID=2634635 RepID=UPI00338E62A3